MNKRFWFTILALITIATMLSACVMSASNAPTKAATSAANKAFPTPVPSTVMGNIQSQTQTAIALSTQPAEKTAEPPAQATATPASGQANEPTATQAAPTKAANVAQPTAVPPTAAPTKAPVAAGPIPTLTRPQTYTLHSGEFPICIARRYDLNMTDLLALNGLNMNSRTSPGLELKIPQSGNWSSGSRSRQAHPTTYTVQANDSIYSIACAFGDVSPEGIMAANGWKDAGSLTAGATISIP